MGISTPFILSTLANKTSDATAIINPTIAPPMVPLFLATPIRIIEPPSTNAMDTPVITQSAK